MFEKEKDVYLIINTGYFGDVLISSKLTRDAKKFHPDKKIVYICDTPYVSVVENLPGVDDVIAYDRKKDNSLFNFIKFIFDFPYKNRIDIALIAQRKSSRPFLAFMLGAKKIVSWDSYMDSDFQKKMSKKNIKYARWAYIDANMLAVEDNRVTDDEDIEFIVPENVQQEMDKFLSEGNYKNLVAINPQAENSLKNWNIDEFIKFTKMLIKDGKTPVLTSLSRDGDSYQKAIENDPELKDKVLDMTDKTNFEQLGALYKRCEKVISIDTGSAHMACAVGTPTIVLFLFKVFSDTWGPLNLQKNGFIEEYDMTAEIVYEKMTKGYYKKY